MPSSVIVIGVRAVNKRDRQQITPLTCVVLPSKDTVRILCILSIHAIDISGKRERKGGRLGRGGRGGRGGSHGGRSKRREGGKTKEEGKRE